jgi:alanine-synthesizing transaminase
VFSRRLPWPTPDNELAKLERALRAAGTPLADLTVSNPTAVDLPDHGAELAAALGAGGDGGAGIARYLPSPLGPPEARAAVAAEYARLGAQVPADCIALTASSSESYALLFKLLADPGDSVLIPQPSYPLFDYLARLEGLVPRAYRLAYDGEWHVDWSSVDVTGARAIVLCNPNNPSGSFLRRADLARLADLAAGAGCALIADEVFADYPLAPAADAVPTVAAASLPALTFALGGLSKSCGLPQMKLGWIAARGPGASEALARLELIADTYLSVGTPVLRALPALLALGARIRQEIRARVASNRAALAATVRPGAPITVLPTEAGWSAVLRLPATCTDERWSLDLLAQHHILVHPGYFFDLPGPGSPLVLSLLTPPETFAQALRTILGAANSA